MLRLLLVLMLLSESARGVRPAAMAAALAAAFASFLRRFSSFVTALQICREEHAWGGQACMVPGKAARERAGSGLLRLTAALLYTGRAWAGGCSCTGGPSPPARSQPLAQSRAPTWHLGSRPTTQQVPMLMMLMISQPAKAHLQVV
jgi:hypothetical protein